MGYRIRRTENELLIRSLHQECFPTDDFYDYEKNIYWVATDDEKVPVAFAIASNFPFKEIFLSRAGVIPNSRSQGLQKRLVRARLRYGHSNNYSGAITYTSTDNGASIKSLLDSGFKIYTPDYYWAGHGQVYFIYEFQSSTTKI